MTKYILNEDEIFKLWIMPDICVSDIASRMGLKSRHSVYDIANRLNWPKRPVNRYVKSKAKKSAYKFNHKKYIGCQVRMIDIKDHQCREIIGLPRNGIMCGLPVERGSYCKHHASINYTASTFKPLVGS